MRKWIFGVIALAVIVLVAVWAWGTLSTISVRVAEPDRREAVRAVYAVGSVKAEQIARLRSELGGKVLKVGVIEGGEIRRGELVMEIEVDEQTLEVRDFDARLQEAKLKVTEARVAYEREKLLFEEGKSTQEAVDNAQAIYNQSQAYQRTVQSALSTRKDQVDLGKIFSPITGVVTNVNVNVGEVIPPNLEAVTVLDPSSFKVFAEINENDINLVKPGQEAVIEFDAMPGERFKARVERVIPQAHEVTKTLPVVLYLVDFVPNLSDGLTATINIVQERRPDVLTIPAAALLFERFDSPEATIFVVTPNNRLEERTIKLGIRGDDYVEILEGLHENEIVALDPEKQWQTGDKVAVQEDEGGQEDGET
jgi:RND family efflux transporter MFP subunit